MAAGALILRLSGGDFSLAWHHSVTKDEWTEFWTTTPEGLQLLAAEVAGPGAGLELPEHAERSAKGWRYSVDLPVQSEVLLAASGMTGSGWQICQSGMCHEVGQEPGQALSLSLCPL